MIYLIWSIINAIVAFYFIFLIFGFIFVGKKVFNHKFKSISIFILFIGIVQVISASSKTENKNTITVNEMPIGNHNSMTKSINLEKNLTMGISLSINYTEKDYTLLPTGSHSHIYGLVSGFNCKFISIQTNKLIPNEKAEYKVSGILEWNLFGINVYSQFKSYQGFID